MRPCIGHSLHHVQHDDQVILDTYAGSDPAWLAASGLLCAAYSAVCILTFTSAYLTWSEQTACPAPWKRSSCILHVSVMYHSLDRRGHRLRPPPSQTSAVPPL